MSSFSTFLKIFLIFSIFIFVVPTEEFKNGPRGVSAEKATFYEEREEFVCLDGSKKIPFDRVNDDYCDCADGSDEPGTSACPNGRFHCRNYGFRPIDLPSSRVNDFVCDCCDGSDEFDSGVECANVCKEMGQQARQLANERKNTIQKGWSKRLELAKEGEKSMEEKKTQIEKMKRELEDLQPIKSAIEATKNDAEKREEDAKNEEDRQWNVFIEEKRKQESASWFAKTDVDKDGKISIDDFKTSIKSESNRELTDEEVSRVFDDQLEIDEEKFRSKFHDFRHFYRKILTTPEPQPSIDEIPPPDEQEEAEDENTEPNEPDDLATNEGDDSAATDETLEPENIDDNSENEKKPEYTEETRRLIDEATKQRDQLRETQNKIYDLEREIKDGDNFLQFEYGSDQAWAPLKGQCLELNQNQYTYRLCLFDRAVQKDRNGHHEVGLGNWRGWEGGEDNKYTIQQYADGQHCWNGPARSTKVHIDCGENSELYEVKEPAKCEYEFWVRSPAACPDPSTIEDPFAVHTEL